MDFEKIIEPIVYFAPLNKVKEKIYGAIVCEKANDIPVVMMALQEVQFELIYACAVTNTDKRKQYEAEKEGCELMLKQINRHLQAMERRYGNT